MEMSDKRAIEVIKENCYVFNPFNIDRAILVNTALDRAVAALKFVDEYGEEIIKHCHFKKKARGKYESRTDHI